MTRARRFLAELRFLLRCLLAFAGVLLLAFLAGSIPGAFIAGCDTIRYLAPGVR